MPSIRLGSTPDLMTELTKAAKFRRRPAVIARKLGMDEIEAIERMVLVDAAIHVHGAFLAAIAP